jgi:hypothetical protein
MKKIIFVTVLLSIVRLASAHEDANADILDEKNVIKHEVFDIKGTKGSVHVVIRNDGHTTGKPFLVELRPDCEGNGDWTKLPVVDVESACEVAISSTKINKSGSQIILNVKGPNQKAYNSGNLKVLKSNSPLCDPNPKQHRFDISTFCK